MSSKDAKRRYRELVLGHIDDAYILAKWLSGNEFSAHEIVQQAAISASSALKTAPEELPKSWFIGIVRHEALNWIAGNRPRHLSLADAWRDMGAEEVERTLATDLDTIDDYNPPGNGEQVRRAIASLPLPLREVLVMREINCLTYKDIAEAIAAPLGTVTTRIALARAAVAGMLRATP